MKKLFSGCILICLAALLVLLPGIAHAEVSSPAQLSDGDYTVEVTLTGGTGRASITSPAVLSVADGEARVRIEWSSPNYDYMLVDGEKYLPVNTEGNSVFEIPLTTFETPLSVTADTTAMSVPHEIDYSLTFDPASIQEAKRISVVSLVVRVSAAVLIFLAYFLWLRRRRMRG